MLLGKLEGKRRGQQTMRWLDSITDSMEMNLSKNWETVKNREVFWAPKSLQMVTAAMKLKGTYSLEGKL